MIRSSSPDQRDAESGLDYAINRYYGNTMGRFVSVDPADESIVLEFPVTWNRYLYTLDDPINHTDPDGLQSCGDTKINGGVFNGRTVSNVMSGKDDYALMAQWLWIEHGLITNQDKADLAGYVADLDRIGSAILNMWLVDNEMVSVFDAQGNRMAPLGSFGHRSLKQLILSPEYARDKNGALFDKNGNMRQAFRNSLNSILKTNIDKGPLIADVGGSMVNISCEGVFQSIIETSKLLTGSRPRTTGPGNSLILFWNGDSATNPTGFPGTTGNFIGVPKVGVAGHTFWALRTH
jgi:RHS repeat-associated protein